MLASEICLLQSGLMQYLSVQDLNHLSDHRPILLKLSSLDPISTHSLRNQTEPKKKTSYTRRKTATMQVVKKHLRKTTQRGLAKKQRR